MLVGLFNIEKEKMFTNDVRVGNCMTAYKHVYMHSLMKIILNQLIIVYM